MQKMAQPSGLMKIKTIRAVTIGAVPIVYEDALYFTGDNGILVSHSLTEPVVYDTAVLTTANIRAGLTYHKGTDALYTVAKDGTLFQIQCTKQKITRVSSGKIMSGAKFITCTSTPTIYNNRLYVGCMADQYGYVCVMDALTLKPIYQVKGFQMLKSNLLLLFQPVVLPPEK